MKMSLIRTIAGALTLSAGMVHAAGQDSRKYGATGDGVRMNIGYADFTIRGFTAL